MSATTENRLAGILSEEAKAAKSNFGWLLAFGLVQIVVGMLAVSFTFSATLASVLMLGILLCFAAGAQLAAAIWVREWKGFFLFLLLGILYAAVGGLMVTRPLLAAEALTLMLAMAFLVGGTFRVAIAWTYRLPSSAWVALNGVVTLLLGVAIAITWPLSSLWVLGMFVGIELIVNGATWIVLATAGRTALTPFVEH